MAKFFVLQKIQVAMLLYVCAEVQRRLTKPEKLSNHKFEVTL